MTVKKTKVLFALIFLIALLPLAIAATNTPCPTDQGCECRINNEQTTQVPEFNPTAIILLVTASIALFLFVRNPKQTTAFIKEHKLSVTIGLLIIVGGTYLASNAQITGFAIVPPTWVINNSYYCPPQGYDIQDCYCRTCPTNMEWNSTSGMCVNETKTFNDSCTNDFDCQPNLICSGGKCICPADFNWNSTLNYCVSETGSFCGNNTREGTEVCDGTDLNGETCANYGYNSGTLTCNADCLGFNISGCYNQNLANCGNEIIDAGETCDGDNLSNKLCTDFDTFTGGTLSCTSSCLLNTSSCLPVDQETECGNGYVETGETCDGQDFNEMNCSDFDSFLPGSLTCDDNCNINTSSCKTGCGEGMNWCNKTQSCKLPNECSDFNETTDCGNSSICEANDSCSCKECDGKQDHCAEGLICDYDQNHCGDPIDDNETGCPPNTIFCITKGQCYNPLLEPFFCSGNDLDDCIANANDICERGESCLCPDCTTGTTDTCDENETCSPSDLCVCLWPLHTCLDGSCKLNCSNNDGDECVNDSNCLANQTCINGGCYIDQDNDDHTPDIPFEDSNPRYDCNDFNSSIHRSVIENCTDTIDNDCDNKIDCADEDCLIDQACEELNPIVCGEGLNWCPLNLSCYNSSLTNCTNGTDIFNETTDCGNSSICEANDSCSCKECDGQIDHCGSGLICQYEKPEHCCNPITDLNCGCPPGKEWCTNLSRCYDPQFESCSNFNPNTDCNNTNVCEKGDSCACPECNGKNDTCDNGAICDMSKDLCVCPYPKTKCLDNTCSLNCSSTDTNNDCTDGPYGSCPDGQVCIGGSNGTCGCPTGTTWNVAQGKCLTNGNNNGGGSNGGGGCTPRWNCTQWSDCGYFSGTRVRTCTDLAHCGVDTNKPAEKDQCRGIPACIDGLKNNGEKGIDCGGKCAPCPTVESCSDNVRNQGELGIDCGGPCANACPQEEKPQEIQQTPQITEKQNWLWLWLLLLLLLVILLIGGFFAYGKSHEKKIVQQPPRVVEPPKPSVTPRTAPQPFIRTPPKVQPLPIIPVAPKPIPVPPVPIMAPQSINTLDEALRAAKSDLSNPAFNGTMHADRIKDLFKKIPVQEKTARFEEVMRVLETIKKRVQ